MTVCEASTSAIQARMAPDRASTHPTADNHEGSVFVVVEHQQIRPVFPQDTFHIVGGAVPQLDPYDFGRRPTMEAEMMEILIFRNDGEPPGFRVLPDDVIGRFSKADVSHVFRVGECVAQAPDELMREIVVE